MALADLISLIDDKLKDTFHKITYDPAKDRAKLAKRIEDTKSKFTATEPARGKKDYSIQNGVVEYRPTFNGQSITIDKRDVLYVPSERFPDVLDHLKSAVEAGELDSWLETIASGNTGEPGEVKPARQRKPGGGGGGGREWTPERRERFAASIAARKAAKDK